MRSNTLRVAMRGYTDLIKELKPLADSVGAEDVQIIVGTIHTRDENDWTFRSAKMVEVAPPGMGGEGSWAFCGVVEDTDDDGHTPKLVTVWLDPEVITHVAFEDFSIARNPSEEENSGPVPDVIVS